MRDQEPLPISTLPKVIPVAFAHMLATKTLLAKEILLILPRSSINGLLERIEPVANGVRNTSGRPRWEIQKLPLEARAHIGAQ